jgi:CheY-like chemotaxis protein
MNILVVEDDPLQRETLDPGLRREFGDVRIEWIQTARALRDWLRDLQDGAPDIVLLDVMLPWQDLGTEAEEAPLEIRQSDYRDIGVHCLSWLLENPRTSAIPIILFTELDCESLSLPPLPAHVEQMRKDAGYPVLHRLMRHLMRSRGGSLDR